MGEDFIREIIFQTLMPVLVSVFFSYISLLIDQLVTSDRYVHLLFCWSEVRYFRAFCVRLWVLVFFMSPRSPFCFLLGEITLGLLLLTCSGILCWFVWGIGPSCVVGSFCWVLCVFVGRITSRYSVSNALFRIFSWFEFLYLLIPGGTYCQASRSS